MNHIIYNHLMRFFPHNALCRVSAVLISVTVTVTAICFLAGIGTALILGPDPFFNHLMEA